MAVDVSDSGFDQLLVHAFDLHRAGKKLGVNPFDNNFIREIVICRQAHLLWNPGRGETDAFAPSGEEYELKSTDIARGRIPQWPTSREVSATVLAAFRSNPKIPWRVVRPGAQTLLLDPRFSEPAF